VGSKSFQQSDHISGIGNPGNNSLPKLKITNMFYTNDTWPISMKSAIERTGLPLKKSKVFAFLREVGAFDEYNEPDEELQRKGYFTCHFERYRGNKSANIPRVSSPEGLNWFKKTMEANLDQVC